MVGVNYAIAECNWQPTKLQEKRTRAHFGPSFRLLPLVIGDRAHVTAVESDWGYGTKEGADGERGLFPMAALTYKEPERTRPVNESNDAIILHEISTAVNTWWPKITNMLKSESDIHFLDDLLGIIEFLLSVHRRVNSGRIPHGESAYLRRSVARKIDRGNKFLKLPMVIRDKTARPYVMGEISIVEAFATYIRRHKALSDMPVNEAKNGYVAPKRSGLASFVFEVKATNLNLFCPAEFAMSLYDIDKRTYLTEPFVFQYLGQERRFEQKNIRCIFKHLDLDSNLSHIVLVTRVSRLSHVEGTGTLNRRLAGPDKNQMNACRQPFGFDIRDLGSIFGEGESTDFRHVDIYLNRQDQFNETLERWCTPILFKMTCGERHSDDLVTINAAMMRGSVHSLMRTYPEFFINNEPAVIRPLNNVAHLTDGIRNELHVTLLWGDFLSKVVDKKNIEVRTSLVDSGDVVIKNVFTNPLNGERMDHHSSYVFLNDERPRWFENFKVLLPNVVENAVVYMRFTFHIKRPMDKSKTDKGPIAISYLKVVDNGLVPIDTEYDLNVYKIESSRSFSPDLRHQDYLHLPSIKDPQEKANTSGSSKIRIENGPYSRSDKCDFSIRTALVSGLLTTSRAVRTILDYKICAADVKDAMRTIVEDHSTKIRNGAFIRDDKTILKFSHALVETLLNIWDDRPDLEQLCFSVIVEVVALCRSHQQKKFKSSIERLALKITNITAAFKLLRSLNTAMQMRDPSTYDNTRNALKNIGWIMSAVSQSYRMGQTLGLGTSKNIVLALNTVLKSMGRLLASEDRALTTVVNTLIKYAPEMVTPLMMTPVEFQRFSSLSCQSAESRDSGTTYTLVVAQCSVLREASGLMDSEMLALSLTNLLKCCGPHVVDTQKLSFISQMIKTPLFMMEQCRVVMMATFLRILLRLMELDEMSVNDIKRTSRTAECVKSILEIIEKLFPSRAVGTCNFGTPAEMETIVTTCLRTTVRTAVYISNSILPTKIDDCRAFVHTLVITLLHHTPQPIFSTYITHHDEYKSDVILEMLQMVRSVLISPPFDGTWLLMHRETNRVIYQILQYMQKVQKSMKDAQFEEIWREYMLSLMAFIIHASAQMNGDLLVESDALVRNAIVELRSTWFMLSPPQKSTHIPGMVHHFVHVAIASKIEVGEIIKVLCDMMVTEYSGCTVQPRNFNSTAREIYAQLDRQIAIEGKGTKQFKDEFYYHLIDNLQRGDHDMYSDIGESFVEEIKKLLELLFEFRDAKSNCDNMENQQRLIVSLLKTYQTNEQSQLAVRYIYMLYKIHIENDHHVEAASTLKLHADMISWDSDELPDWMVKSNCNRNCATHRQLKAALMKEIAELYARGDLYEKAIETYRQIVDYYEKTAVDFDTVSTILSEMSRMFKKIQEGLRIAPFYYCVWFLGSGHSPCVRGREFVYHANPDERLPDFVERIRKSYKAKLIEGNVTDFEPYMHSDGRHIHIYALSAIPNRVPFETEVTSDAVKLFYQHYHIQKFEVSKTFMNEHSKWMAFCKKDTARDTMKSYSTRRIVTTAEELPGITSFSQVTLKSDPTVLTPLQTAIQQMTNANIRLESLARGILTDDKLDVRTLESALLGICQARVMGGISNYEPFYAPEIIGLYNAEEAGMVETLRKLILKQATLCEYGCYVNGKMSGGLRVLVVDGYRDYRSYVTSTFGAVEESMLPPGETIDGDARSVSASTVTLSAFTSPSDGANNTLTRKIKHQIRKSTSSALANVIGSPRHSETSSLIMHLPPLSPSPMTPVRPSDMALTSPSPARISSRMPRESIAGKDIVDESIDRMKQRVGHRPRLPLQPPPEVPSKPMDNFHELPPIYDLDEDGAPVMQAPETPKSTSIDIGLMTKNRPLPPTPVTPVLDT